MSKVEDFLTAAQEKDIIEAIRLAETNTSGEIRVHLEKTTDKDPIERAKEVFYFLKMDETKQHNGVLFYVAVDDKKFSILGDKGINSVVSNSFWDTVKGIVIRHFKEGNFTEGLKLGIIETGEQLKQHFPYQEDDKNELTDSISSS